MAETNFQALDGDGAAGKGGMMPLLLALALVTALGAGGGAALGFLFGGTDVPAANGEPAPAQDDPAPAPTNGNEAADHQSGDATITELAADEKRPLQVVTLKPVVTNLYNPVSAWIRIEASIVFRQGADVDEELLATEIEADTLTFLRSLQIAQIEGTRGLLHLREDLRERAKLRSPAVVDYLLTTMIVE